MALVPLLYSLYSARTNLHAIRTGAIFGLVFSGLFHGWLMNISPWATTGGAFGLLLAISLYSTLFFILFALGVHHLKDDVGPLILMPILWVVCEYLRSVGPFGNMGGAIGYTQADCSVILQWASVFGVWGLSAFVVFVNGLIFAIIRTPFQNLSRRFWSGAGILALIILFGMVMAGDTIESTRDLSVAIVQPNHPQMEKLNARLQPSLRADILDITSQITDADVVVLPETITPSLNLKNADFTSRLSEIANTNGFDVVFGTPAKTGKGLHNVMTVMGPKGVSKHHYNKRRLMPFGEYIPLRLVFMSFDFMNALFPYDDYIPGKPGALLHAGGAPLGSAICLEGIYADAYTHQVRSGAQYLVLAANNAWFGHSSAGPKLLQMARVRATEQNRALLLSANTGVSAVISPKGEVIMKSKMGQKTVLRSHIPLISEQSIYTRYPWIVIALAFVLTSFGIVRRSIRSQELVE